MRSLFWSSWVLVSICVFPSCGDVNGGAYSSEGAEKNPSRVPVGEGELTAGEVDDNLNYKAFRSYYSTFYPDYTTPKERFHLHLVDSKGKGMSNIRLGIGKNTYYTTSDGHFYFFPSFEGLEKSETYKVNIFSKGSLLKTEELSVEKSDKRIEIEVQNVQPKALDMMFVIDTTASMSDELDYIKEELAAIIGRVKVLYSGVKMRFALVVYRDEGDDYVYSDFGFSDSLAEMQKSLDRQNTDGGGDFPEAMDKAMDKAMQMNWSEEGNVSRMLFLIADAPPHDGDIEKTLKTSIEAHQKGIRIYPLGASGIDENAEFIMRNLALVSNGRYHFLTDDSGIGNSHLEPKASCYVVTKYKDLVFRTISSELLGKRALVPKEEIIREVGHQNEGVCVEEKESSKNGK